MIENVTKLSCAFDPAEIKDNSGGGADCWLATDQSQGAGRNGAGRNRRAFRDVSAATLQRHPELAATISAMICF